MQQRKIRIKDLPENDRPREKIFVKGRDNLTDTELIALLIGSGTKKQNALKLSKIFLRNFPLQSIPFIPAKDFLQTSGIGMSKAARIIAAVELGGRIFAPKNLEKTIIRTNEDVVNECKKIVDKTQEHLLALFLNARHELIKKEIIALGNVNSLRIEPKEIFSHAVSIPCIEIILAHNHPSGNPYPSKEDIFFTKKVQEAGKVMGIPVSDHFIFSKTGYFSFKDNRQY